MPELWVYVIGGIIVAVITLTIGYTLYSNTIDYSQRQEALSQFSDFSSSLNIVCLQEFNNSMTKKFTITQQVRVIYATNDIVNPLPTVIDRIKDAQSSLGRNVCMQFKDEQELRCYPDPPKKLACNVTMPYLGNLPEQEDIFVAVSRILGRGPIREYSLFIQKTSGDAVTVSIL
jgi:hypothetical protein